MTFTVPIFIKLQQKPHRNKLNEMTLTFENFSYTLVKFPSVFLHINYEIIITTFSFIPNKSAMIKISFEDGNNIDLSLA